MCTSKNSEQRNRQVSAMMSAFGKTEFIRTGSQEKASYTADFSLRSVTCKGCKNNDGCRAAYKFQT